MLHVRPHFAIAVAMIGFIAHARAQSVLWKFEGDSSGDSFGLGTAGAGDVDQDGRPDLALGAYLDDNTGIDSGSLHVYSGRDGHLLFVLNGQHAGDWFGRAASRTGDVNGDGFADFVVGASHSDANGSDSGSGTVYSGKDSSVLFSNQGAVGDYLGWAVSGAEDVDLDGVPDFAISAHDHVTMSKADYVLVLSGKDGHLLYRFNGDHQGHTLGTAVALLGDVDGDGHADILAGAGFDDTSGTDAGSARLFSGATGAILIDLHGQAAGDRFGNSLAPAGDVDADRVPDFVIGANGTDVNGTDSGTAYVYSGRTYALIFRVDGQHAGDFLANASGAGDLNSDGHAELLIGAPSASGANRASGIAWLVSGLTGRSLYTFQGQSNGDFFGRDMSFMGDADGDGIDDLPVAAPSSDENGSNSGSAFVFRGNDLFLQASKTSLQANDTLQLDTRGGAPNGAAAIFLTAVDGAPQTLLIALNALDANGEWRFTAVVPPGLSGHTITFKSYAIGPTGRVVDSEDVLITFL